MSKSSAPKHIAIIPDGNRRWAKAHRLNAWEGHEEGSKLYWEIGFAALDAGINHMTFWAGSYDNLKKRTKLEVSFLIKLAIEELSKPNVLKHYLEKEVRFRLIGEWREFIVNKKAVTAIEELEQKTAHFKSKTQTILFAYDGQREMLAAANALVKTGKTVTSENLRKELWTAELPDVDLVIRTGGEPHWSAGFMMWHTANSQLYFTDILWPDFKTPEFKKALEDFERRERRLGK